jgi:hypothetical protein
MESAFNVSVAPPGSVRYLPRVWSIMNDYVKKILQKPLERVKIGLQHLPPPRLNRQLVLKHVDGQGYTRLASFVHV